MEILKKFFTPLSARTYGKPSSYNFVDFLLSRAGGSNCGGDNNRRCDAQAELRPTKQAGLDN